MATMRMVGGHPAIDFVNTLGGRIDDPNDEYLHGYADLLTWCRRTGLLHPETHAQLVEIAGGSPRLSQRALTSATNLRAALDSIVRARLDGRPQPSADLGTVRRRYISALRHAELRLDSQGCAWAFPLSECQHLELPEWMIAVQAVDLLEQNRLHSLGQCEHCRWLFLDTTRNHARRWCSMNACGAANKMRRYRAQSRRPPG